MNLPPLLTTADAGTEHALAELAEAAKAAAAVWPAHPVAKVQPGDCSPWVLAGLSDRLIIGHPPCRFQAEGRLRRGERSEAPRVVYLTPETMDGAVARNLEEKRRLTLPPLQ